MNSIGEKAEPQGAVGTALPFAGTSLQCGFPSPAEDFMVTRLDLYDRLVDHPQATFFFRSTGHSMVDAGIDDGDLLVVDRALKPVNHDIVVAIVDGEFTVKYLQLRSGRLRLKAANATFPDIIPRDGQTVEVWGVVTACVKEFRKLRR